MIPKRRFEAYCASSYTLCSFLSTPFIPTSLYPVLSDMKASLCGFKARIDSTFCSPSSPKTPVSHLPSQYNYTTTFESKYHCNAPLLRLRLVPQVHRRVTELSVRTSLHVHAQSRHDPRAQYHLPLLAW